MLAMARARHTLRRAGNGPPAHRENGERATAPPTPSQLAADHPPPHLAHQGGSPGQESSSWKGPWPACMARAPPAGPAARLRRPNRHSPTRRARGPGVPGMCCPRGLTKKRGEEESGVSGAAQGAGPGGAGLRGRHTRPAPLTSPLGALRKEQLPRMMNTFRPCEPQSLVFICRTPSQNCAKGPGKLTLAPRGGPETIWPPALCRGCCARRTVGWSPKPPRIWRLGNWRSDRRPLRGLSASERQSGFHGDLPRRLRRPAGAPPPWRRPLPPHAAALASRAA